MIVNAEYIFKLRAEARRCRLKAQEADSDSVARALRDRAAALDTEAAELESE